jgi:hypothetical protein
MEAFIFVLVINLSPMSNVNDWFYVGHFKTCSQANLYAELHYPGEKATRCLFEEYIKLPEDYKRRVIDIHDSCKLRRDCDDA